MPDQPTANQPVRPAATVMLVRDTVDELQVYLLRRVAAMAFAGGMTVFPGGGLDPRDAAPVGWDGPDAGWWAQQFGIDQRLAHAVVVAAVREVFEETGVLLADVPADAPVLDPAQREALRQRVDSHQLGLVDVIAGGRIHSGNLRPWARWITPPGRSRRYDTFFLLAELPPGADPQLLTTEAEHGQWVNPRRALEAAERQELNLMSPTIAMLTSLAGFDTVAQAVAARKDAQALSPTIRTRSGVHVQVSAASEEFRAFVAP